MSDRPPIWQILAISPTSDATAIRRAYAAKLKVTQPEDDPESFKVLRAAYEAALEHARSAQASQQQPAAHAATAAEYTHERRDEPPASAAQPATVDDAEIAALRRAFDVLRAELAAPGDDLEQRTKHALESLLKQPALANVRVEREAEDYLAMLLAGAIPHSDTLLDTAAQRFGWLKDGLRATPAVSAVVGRLDDLEFLKELNKNGSQYARAFRGLRQRKTPVLSWLRSRIHRSGEVGEYQLLQMLRLRHPGLLPLLNADAVAWWDRVASRPQLSTALLVSSVVLGGPLLLVGSLVDRVLVPGIVALVGCLALALWKLYLVDLPRHRLGSKWSADHPPWVAAGWLPLGVVCMAATVPQPQPAILAIAAAGGALLAFHWALIFRAAWPPPGLPTGDLVAFFAPEILLALWWLVSSESFPAGNAWATSIPFFALLGASAFGTPTVRMLWLRRFTPLQRRALMGALVLLAIASAPAVWSLAAEEQWRPACVALVMTLVALHRPFTHDLSRAQRGVRGGWAAVLLTGLFVAGAMDETAAELEARGRWLVGGSLILLATIAFGLALAAWSDSRLIARAAAA